MALEVSEIRVFASSFDTGSTVGYGQITFCEAVTIKYNILKAGDGRLFVSWPQRKKKDSDEYTSFITFATVEVRNKLGDAIIGEFNKKLGISSGGKANITKPVSVVVATKDEPVAKEEVQPKEETKAPETKKSGITWG